MDERELEFLKHRLRVREILLDKLGLALFLGALLFAGNWWMKSYESRLQTQLDQLKEVYNFQRILAEKDITAHENVWNAISQYRHAANDMLGKTPGKPPVYENAQALQAAAIKLVEVADANYIYLTPQTRSAVNEFTGKSLDAFGGKWEQDGDSGLSQASLKFLGDAADRVRAQVESDITARRDTSRH